MGVRRSACLGVALSVPLLMLVPGPAAAAGKHGSSGGGGGETSFAETLRTSGQVVYSWRGDPARGCAQVGVCGVHGSLVIQPEGRADAFDFSFLGVGAEVSFEGVSAD